jgi:hypothetical protein
MTRDDLEALKRDLLVEQIKYFRAANLEREREEREREFESFLSRRWGYPLPRRRRRR